MGVGLWRWALLSDRGGTEGSRGRARPVWGLPQLEQRLPGGVHVSTALARNRLEDGDDLAIRAFAAETLAEEDGDVVLAGP